MEGLDFAFETQENKAIDPPWGDKGESFPHPLEEP